MKPRVVLGVGVVGLAVGLMLSVGLAMPAGAQTFAPTDSLPFDKNVKTGTLANGLKYYIRVNHKPEKRALLRLVVNAGSILEGDDERGFAHFVEHMAFDGTKNFPKKALTNYLESIGMRFGPELNAYTSFDETVYMLEVPTDSAGVIDKAIEILADWAQNVSFDDDEIDKERGVVIEEWRQGQGAGMRILQKELPVILKDSKYASRIPIGTKEVIESFSHQALRDFYKTWYRPDLMAVVAVGDFDPQRIEALIGDRFSPMQLSASRKPREVFPVPDQDQFLSVVATDPEMPQTVIALYHRLNMEPRRTVAGYKAILIEDLYNRMLGARLLELTQRADPPFTYATSSKARFIRAKQFYQLSATAREDGILLGLESLVVSAERVRRYGFTATELERQKDQLLRSFEKAYSEKDKTESSIWASKYVAAYLYNDPIPGIENTYQLAKQLVPEITLDDVNHLADQWTSDKNSVLVLQAPQKPGLVVPSEQQLLAAVADAKAKDIKPYEDKVSQEPLVQQPPAPGKVTSEQVNANLGLTEWTLANGVRVLLKPTDFKNDDIQIWGYSPGGTSLASDSAFISAASAATVVGQSGVGRFDFIELRKRLSGKIANVSPDIDELIENLRGSASPKDVETMFQLVYLYFVAARLDSSAYLSYKSRMEPYLKNRGASPDAAFEDTISATLTQYHPRRPLWNLGTLAKMDLGTCYNFYRDRFADASDFTFILVGAFDLEHIRPLVETYLGGLPSIRRNETWRDVGVRFPAGIIKKDVRKGLEPRSRVSLTFAGPASWSLQSNYDLGAMGDALRIKLREAIREDQSGSYDIDLTASSWKLPYEGYNVTIDFGCDPKRVDELVGDVFAQIDSLAAAPLPESYITKVKETERRELEVELKQNGYWLSSLWFYDFYKLDKDDILKAPERIDGLTAQAIQAAAKTYLRRDNYVQVVLDPAEK
ncbi:MAG TPA: insulinase family protein [bacterium]|nr:insulinase family protein [bacterium]